MRDNFSRIPLAQIMWGCISAVYTDAHKKARSELCEPEEADEANGVTGRDAGGGDDDDFKSFSEEELDHEELAGDRM